MVTAPPDTKAPTRARQVSVEWLTRPLRDATSTRAWSQWVLLAGRLLILFCIVVGGLMRLWYLFHLAPNSDSDVVGLMARGIEHGQFTAFFWGQRYGGSLEAWMVALAFRFFGQSGIVLGLAPGLLYGAGAVLVWRVARRLVNDRLLASLAGALVWVAPAINYRLSTTEFGFRGVTMVCGLAALLVTLRILDGRRNPSDFVGLGLAVGIGWWSSPEVIFFLVPAGALLIAAIAGPRQQRAKWFWPIRLSLTLVATIVGALPWLWVNLGDGFRSLATSSFPGGHSPNNHGYGARLSDFGHHALPLVTGTALPGHNALPGVLGPVLIFVGIVLTVGCVMICMVTPGRAQAIGLGLVAFPFLYALNPATWYWVDGRYAMYLPLLLALALAIACAEGPRLIVLALRQRPLPQNVRRLVGRISMAVIVAACGLLALRVFAISNQSILDKNGSFFGGWVDPGAPIAAEANQLEAAGITTGYANYWVSYPLDFSSAGRLAISPGPWEPIRSMTIYHRVTSSADPAWIFVPTSQTNGSNPFFASGGPLYMDPGGLTEPRFIAALDHLGIGYQVIHVGHLDAVIPNRQVTGRQVGIF